MERRQHGFTLVEIAVVVTVVAFLASMIIVMFSVTQAKSRDDKRRADIALLADSLERFYDENGEYPTGCSTPMTAGANNSCIWQYLYYPLGNGAASIYYDKSSADLRSLLNLSPSVTVGDPKGNSAYPFQPTPDGKSYYFYIGEHSLTTTWAVSFSGRMAPFCSNPGVYNDFDYRSNSSGQNKRTTYLLGYWSEADQKWHFQQGRRGESRLVRYTGMSPYVPTPLSPGTLIGSQCVLDT